MLPISWVCHRGDEMKKLFCAFCVVLVSGCVNIEYSKAGAPDMSAFSAHMECSKLKTSNSGAVLLAGLPFGALGGALAGALRSQDDSGKDAFENCMQSHGWVKN